MKQIDEDVLAVLADGVETSGCELRIMQTLHRDLYTKVNKVLVACGGTWVRGRKAHVFAGDAAEMIEGVVLTGEYLDKKQELGAFYTPAPLAARIVAEAKIQKHETVLEPSAGRGGLAVPAYFYTRKVHCCEIDAESVAHLREIGLPYVVQSDFLTEWPPTLLFDVVLMNPPFAKQADIEHVTHALGFLRPGGRLVAIMSAATRFRTNKKAVAFFGLIGSFRRSKWEVLPPGSFKESGTNVNAVTLTVQT